MREIKFRVYSKTEKCFHYFTLANILQNEIEFQRHIINGDEFQQSVGICDQNGKEVFEKDVIKDWNGKMGYIMFGRVLDSAAIAYSGFYKRYNQDEYGNLDGSFEVIGNVSENPDLIKQAV